MPSLSQVAMGILAVVLLKLLYDFLTSPLRHVPGPLICNFTDFWRFVDVWLNGAHTTQRRLHEQYGDVVRLGPRNVSVSDPDLIKIVYGTKERWPKSEFYAAYDVRVGKQSFPTGFSTRSEEMHSTITRPIAKFYTAPAVQRYESRLNSTIQLFIIKLDDAFAFQSKPCPLDTWMHFCAWDVLASMTFGQPFGFIATGSDVQDLISTSTAQQDYLALMGQIPWLDRLINKNPYFTLGAGAFSFAAQFAAKQLAARQAGTDGHDSAAAPDFLDDFIALKTASSSSSGEAPVTDQRITQWLLRNINAGSDTTAISLRSTIYFLLRHPRCRDRLVAELDAAGVTTQVQASGGGDVPSYAALTKLPYLSAVVAEALRLHSPVALPLERVVPPAGCRLPGGVFLPGGTAVGVNPYVISRRTDVYGTDLDSFVPERWLRGDGETAEGYEARVGRMREADFTFGAGKRMCAGRHIAFVELYKITAALVARFGMELVDGREWRTYNRYFWRQTGINVRLRRREVVGES